MHYHLSLIFLYLFFFFYYSASHPDLHSFPTRRSSDLTIASSSRATGVYTGQSSISRCPGIATTTCSFQVARYRPSSVTRPIGVRSEEHTSELQSRGHLVCRLLLEKKKTKKKHPPTKTT